MQGSKVEMTGREFKRLIQLESMFYGMKSLAIGSTGNPVILLVSQGNGRENRDNLQNSH